MPFLTVLVPYFGPLLSQGGTARPIKLPKTGQKVDLRWRFGTPKRGVFDPFLDPLFDPILGPLFEGSQPLWASGAHGDPSLGGYLGPFWPDRPEGPKKGVPKWPKNGPFLTPF